MILTLPFILTMWFISRICQLSVSMGILHFCLRQMKCWFHQNFYQARLSGHQTVNLVCSPPLDQLPFLAKLFLPTLLLIRIVILHNFIPYHWFTTALLTVFLTWSFDMNVTWPHFCSITVSSLLANGRNMEFRLWLEKCRILSWWFSFDLSISKFLPP